MPTGEEIVQTARNALGVPYVWGGNSLSSGVDCSGLVQQVFQRYGISLPRVTYDQIKVGQSVSRKRLRPGDLVFFDTDRSRGGPDHVGIYMGGGKFIHAPRPGSEVKISSLGDSYYAARWMGGRRISGVAASSPGGYSVPVEPEPRRLGRGELAERYGMSTAFFNSVPELRKLLGQAVDGQWSSAKFTAELRNTDWWGETSKPAREAQVLRKSDPATYEAKMEAARVQARQMAVELGAILSDERVAELAKNIVHLEWNEAQIANFLGRYVDFFDNGVLGGVAGQVQRQLHRTAYDLGIRMDEQSVLNNAQYVVRGLTTMQDLLGQMRSRAAGMYPAFEEQIKAGASMREIAEPYIQVVSTELGVPATDVGMFDPQIKEALNHLNASGEPEPMSVSAFTRMIRNEPEWGATLGARNKTLSMGQEVLSALGLTA